MIGPDEVERFGGGYVHRLGASAPVICEESVEQAANLACGARVYIGHDAGMTHVAALAGVRTLAIFGPTDPRVWRPLGRDCHVVDFPTPDGLTEWADDLTDQIGPP
jgi:ADP-heptose:LPS heptosyltransferase